MNRKLYKKSETPDLTTPAAQKAFIEEVHSGRELICKELEINKVEQTILNRRIQMMKEFVNDLSADDPQYSMLLSSIEMDRIEWDELKAREWVLISKLSEHQ